nr:hypothetical protein [uncultured Oscillibacter sp.]
MLDNQDKEYIKAAISEAISESEERMTKKMQVLIENEVTPKFNMLADILMDLKDDIKSLSGGDSLQEIKDKVDVHDAIIKRHSEDIAALKKAQ